LCGAQVKPGHRTRPNGLDKNLKRVPEPNSLEFGTVIQEIPTDRALFNPFAQARQW